MGYQRVGLVVAVLIGWGMPAPVSAGVPLHRSGYVVMVRSSVVAPTEVLDGLGSVEVSRQFRLALTGFAAELDAGQVTALLADRRVLSVEADVPVRVADVQGKPISDGIDRIDQRALPLSETFAFEATGRGVVAYVVDSGILGTHREFEGRAVPGVSTARDSANPMEDCTGHGTGVAGSLGGTTYGVAKEVTLVSVKVIGCGSQGPLSSVLAGIEWVIDHHTTQPAVANLSLGSLPSPSLDQAVAALAADGIVATVAAGNTAEDACGYSPQRVPSAITVGASHVLKETRRGPKLDAVAAYSNTGSCVDLFAPGKVKTAGTRHNSAQRRVDGTSNSAPHVAGVVAQARQLHPNAGASTITQLVLDKATTGALRMDHAAGSSPNLLLFTDM